MNDDYLESKFINTGLPKILIFMKWLQIYKMLLRILKPKQKLYQEIVETDNNLDLNVHIEINYFYW